MKRRKLGTLEVSEIGFGCKSVSGNYGPAADMRAELRRLKRDSESGWKTGDEETESANHWYAEYLMTMGRHTEAMARIKNGQELDPLSLIINVAVGWSFYCARRYDEAIEQLRRAVELHPNYPVTYWILGLLLRKTGCYELAITKGEKAVKLSGGSPLMRAALAHTLGTAGRTKEAFAGIHIGLREHDRAIEYLEKSYEEHSHWSIYLHIDPSMDELRDNARFQDLLRRVGLPAVTAAIRASSKSTGFC
jgi:tetratricopeptide (TPR) repeat protein